MYASFGFAMICVCRHAELGIFLEYPWIFWKITTHFTMQCRHLSCRKLTYPTLGKGTSSSKSALLEDKLSVPSRVKISWFPHVSPPPSQTCDRRLTQDNPALLFATQFQAVVPVFILESATQYSGAACN